ncbi:MAG: OmpA family protein [Candidatus Omnitrophica bacterium]|nr:OmpA family protein [Candidatus Omnitrophota bacterium]
MRHLKTFSRLLSVSALAAGLLATPTPAQAQFIDQATRDTRREADLKNLQETFAWWPTDAKPAPVKDEQRGGYWWWPAKTGSVTDLWGNRGYVYVYKLIYDYKEKEAGKKEAPAPAPKVETKASLLIKKIIRNVKIYFDYNKADLRNDHLAILDRAVGSLQKNPKASILITGNCDARGSEEYNMKLGKKRSDTVKQYMLDKGITEERIKIVSRGKLDAVAPVKDLMGMQKDRNAQFMVAEVDEVNIPADQVPSKNANLQVSDDGSYVVEEKENVESGVKVSTKEYTIQANDSLWKIAQKEMGNGNRWQYLYELNKDRIKNANKLKKGTVIIIPIE